MDWAALSWPVAHRHYAAHADQLLTEPGPPAVWTSVEFETNFTDSAGQGRLLGQVAERTDKAVTGWLDDRGQA